MDKNSRCRVRKHRVLQTAREKEVKYVNEIIARSSCLENNMSSSERNKNGKFLLCVWYFLIYSILNIFYLFIQHKLFCLNKT